MCRSVCHSAFESAPFTTRTVSQHLGHIAGRACSCTDEPLISSLHMPQLASCTLSGQLSSVYPAMFVSSALDILETAILLQQALEFRLLQTKRF